MLPRTITRAMLTTEEVIDVLAFTEAGGKAGPLSTLGHLASAVVAVAGCGALHWGALHWLVG